jgi:nucleotide-binding universal stress UspA family protein
MLHNVLIAVDGSRNSLRAVEYAGRVARKAERADLAGLYWRLEDEEKIGRFFAEATNLLVQVGVKSEQIKSKFGVKKAEIAPAILEEVELGHYETLVVGRRGLSRMREFFLGSVSTELVREAQGCAVCVVE